MIRGVRWAELQVKLFFNGSGFVTSVTADAREEEPNSLNLNPSCGRPGSPSFLLVTELVCVCPDIHCVARIQDKDLLGRNERWRRTGAPV